MQCNQPNSNRPVPRWPFIVYGAILIMLWWVARNGLPITFGHDFHNERCLTNFHVGLLMHWKPAGIHRGDLLFFRPSGDLSYVKEPYVMKRVAGIPGDRLVIHGDIVSINGQVIATGLPLIGYYHKSITGFEKNEIIPKNEYFMIGNHPRSDDSRYWGYLDYHQIAGFAKEIY